MFGTVLTAGSAGSTIEGYMVPRGLVIVNMCLDVRMAYGAIVWILMSEGWGRLMGMIHCVGGFRGDIFHPPPSLSSAFLTWQQSIVVELNTHQ